MRNSGTEPSPMTLAKKGIFKSFKDMSQTYQNKEVKVMM